METFAVLPNWLNGQTIAILTACLAVAAMQQTGTVALRTEMHQLRAEMHAGFGDLRREVQSDVGELRQEVRSDIGELRRDVGRLNERVRGVEIRLAAIEAVLPLVRGPVSPTPASTPPLEVEAPAS